MLTFFFFAVLILGAIAVSRLPIRVGTLSAKGLGSLHIGEASPAEVRSSLGAPTSIWQQGEKGAPIAFAGELWRYECPAVFRPGKGSAPCETYVGFRGGHLQTISTSDPTHFTNNKLLVEATISAAVRIEKGTWSGWGAKCPSVVFPSPSDVVYEGLVSRDTPVSRAGRVSAFYLSAKPASFSACPA